MPSQRITFEARFQRLASHGQAYFDNSMALKVRFQRFTSQGQAYFYNFMSLKVRFQRVAILLVYLLYFQSDVASEITDFGLGRRNKDVAISVCAAGRIACYAYGVHRFRVDFQNLLCRRSQAKPNRIPRAPIA